MSGRRVEILEAAIAIADESGLGAVSMRAVAQRVGLTAMALYPHLGGGKDALLDGMVGQLLAQLPRPEPESAWQDRIRSLTTELRALGRAHPAGITLLFTRPAVSPDAIKIVEVIYQALLDAGVPDAEVPRLERLVSTFVLGFVTSETNGRFGTGTADPRTRRGRLPSAEIPAHERLERHLDASVDLDRELHLDVEDLIDIVARRGGDPRRDS